jgi:hypothetical protein
MANLGVKQLVKRLEESDKENILEDYYNKEELRALVKAFRGLQPDLAEVSKKEHQLITDSLFLFSKLEDQIEEKYGDSIPENFNTHTTAETAFIGLLRQLQEKKLGDEEGINFEKFGDGNFNPAKFETVKKALYSTEKQLSIDTIIKEISARYPQDADDRERDYSEDKPSMQYLEEFRERIEKWSEGMEDIIVNKSGVGGWASTPWVAALDTRITESTKRGVYVVFFVDPRQDKFYITLGQGTQDLNGLNSEQTKKEILRKRAKEIQTQIKLKSFETGQPDLTTQSRRDKFYPPATAFYKDWNIENLPEEREILNDFLQLTRKYQKWIYSWEDPIDFLKYNPDAVPRKVVGSPDHFITSTERRCWGFESISSSINEGDVVIIHSSSNSKNDDLDNPDPGLIGVGVVDETLENHKEEPWWLAEFTSDQEWPDILKFKKMFLTGETAKLDLSRNVYLKYQEDKEILNREMKALLKGSMTISRANEIADEVNEDDRGFPSRVNGGRFLDKDGDVNYELPIKIMEEMQLK